jgi:hypothetical protein
MMIGSNAVQAAITQVDARTGCKFTATGIILVSAIQDSMEQAVLLAAKKTLSVSPEASGHGFQVAEKRLQRG